MAANSNCYSKIMRPLFSLKSKDIYPKYSKHWKKIPKLINVGPRFIPESTVRMFGQNLDITAIVAVAQPGETAFDLLIFGLIPSDKNRIFLM